MGISVPWLAGRADEELILLIAVHVNVPECSVPVVPDHGRISNQSGRHVGATAQQLCDKGYKPSGTSVITCLEDGLWSEPPVTCIKIGNAVDNYEFCKCTVCIVLKRCTFIYK